MFQDMAVWLRILLAFAVALVVAYLMTPPVKTFATEEYVDMFEAGILDPAKVTRSALQNAASVASMVLTTESLVADEKEEKDPMAGAPGAGMGGMM